MAGTVLQVASDIELALTNSTIRVDIVTFDADGAATDTTELSLTIFDTDGTTVIHYDGYPAFAMTGTVTIAAASDSVVGTGTLFEAEILAGDTITIDGDDFIVEEVVSDTELTLTTTHLTGVTDEEAEKATRIISPDDGHYYFPWGDRAAAANLDEQTETADARDVVFLWQAVIGTDTEQRSRAQTIRCITPKTYTMLGPFRDLIDKSRKLVSEDPDDPCFLGYSDAQLVEWLIQGVQQINTYEPYPTWCTLDSFPTREYGYLLYQSALVIGVMSQQLFAIDTDIPSYSNSGNTFVIQHGPQLAAFLTQLCARLDKMIPIFKHKFVSIGRLHVEYGPNDRMTQMVQAAPTGSLFRNTYFRG